MGGEVREGEVLGVAGAVGAVDREEDVGEEGVEKSGDQGGEEDGLAWARVSCECGGRVFDLKVGDTPRICRRSRPWLLSDGCDYWDRRPGAVALRLLR